MEIIKLIKKSVKELQREKVFPEFAIPEIKIEHPEEKVHGDYATNVAMVISKVAKKSPLEIAKLLIANGKLQMANLFEKVEVVEPGFINFFLSKDIFLDEIKAILKEKDKYGSSKINKGKTVVIDYSAPNIAKSFGIGHLRSTIIGQALYNSCKFLGFKCVGDNHLGDWGTQFGKLIVAIKNWGKKKIKDYSIDDLEKLYVKFHKKAELNPKLKDEARNWFLKLEEGDKEAKKIWKECVNISLKEFDRIYKLLGIKIDYAFGESFYLGMLKEIIEEAKNKKVATESQGALIIKYPNDELPLSMILKSDGATTYLTRDLATIKYRLKRWKPALIIYEVGADQTLHLKQLFLAAELLGWSKKAEGERAPKFFHVGHGLYRTKTGKFSTRAGKTIHLEEVLNEAILRAKKIIEESETSRGLSKKEIENVAKAVGIGAIKYNDLSSHYSRDIIFDWEKILNLKGNSGPYLQYTFARCQSVLNKAGFKIKTQSLKSLDFKQEETDILRTIYKFPEVVEESAKNFSPNLITNFVFDLAQKYNLFYNSWPILKAETKELRDFRLILTQAVAQVLKNGLLLLGIESIEKM